MATSAKPTPSITIISGAQSRRFTWPKAMAIPTRWGIHHGPRCSLTIQHLTTTQAIVSQGARHRRHSGSFSGTNNIGFTICSLTLPPGQRCTDPSPVSRSYTSFSEAAEENAFSRILVGLHFRDAVETGTQHGRKIGRRAVTHFLRPTH